MLQWILVIVVIIWLGVITFYLYGTVIHYQRLVKGTQTDNLTKILNNILEEQNLSKLKFEKLDEKLQKQIKNSVYNIQKVGILRFNPFTDTGGDQSFVLAILDGTDSGIVLTSLHSRGMTRWYAKNIKEGNGVDYKLSEEEIKSIKQAKLIKTE